MNIRDITQRIADALDDGEPRCARAAQSLAAALRLHGHAARITGGAFALAVSKRPADTRVLGYVDGRVCVGTNADGSVNAHFWVEAYGLVCDASWSQARRHVLALHGRWTLPNCYVGPRRNGHGTREQLHAGEVIYTPVDAPVVRDVVAASERLLMKSAPDRLEEIFKSELFSF